MNTNISSTNFITCFRISSWCLGKSSGGRSSNCSCDSFIGLGSKVDEEPPSASLGERLLLFSVVSFESGDLLLAGSESLMSSLGRFSGGGVTFTS